MPKKGTKKQKNANGANPSFEAKLWAAADKLRGNMEPSDYKHVAFRLIFLQYISDDFTAKHEAMLKEDLSYPPNLPETAVQTALQQSEVLSERWAA